MNLLLQSRDSCHDLNKDLGPGSDRAGLPAYAVLVSGATGVLLVSHGEQCSRATEERQVPRWPLR